ncbi:hypothetical protein ElyMa_002312600 [Elysia marginata]|uniref:Uncharacterized protein n=1 Tax=Elysia marginata TaxID=1093978 RepID=A0AAV4G6P5_9GAST|nr:hypothetical protein ElyMa_002312600 [Elysia marginata]
MADSLLVKETHVSLSAPANGENVSIVCIDRPRSGKENVSKSAKAAATGGPGEVSSSPIHSTNKDVNGVPGSGSTGDISPSLVVTTSPPIAGTMDKSSLEGATAALDCSSFPSGGQTQASSDSVQPQGNTELEEIDVDATDIVPVSLRNSDLSL